MASTVYKQGLAYHLGGGVDVVNDDIVALLVDTSLYTADFETDQYQDDIPTEAQIKELSLTGKTIDGNSFLADTIVFPGVSTGLVGALAILHNTGSTNTSRLLAYIESPDFPIIPDGTPITIQWDVSGVYSL